MVLSVSEEYRGYEIEVERDGGGHYVFARPLSPKVPILSLHKNESPMLPRARAGNCPTAVDRLLDNR